MNDSDIEIAPLDGSDNRNSRIDHRAAVLSPASIAQRIKDNCHLSICLEANRASQILPAQHLLALGQIAILAINLHNHDLMRADAGSALLPDGDQVQNLG